MQRSAGRPRPADNGTRCQRARFVASGTRTGRCTAAGLIHHSDRGVQYLAIRYSEPLDEADVVPSVGSRGDSYDNALAESFNGLYKAELIRHRGPWRGLDDVEYATLEYVAWFNHCRLHGELGMRPPAEFEALLAGQTGLLPLAASQ